jgi:aminoglycoside phosphotransferase (APT) family kinase protein
MDSITKSKLTPEIINDLVKHSFGTDVTATEIMELTDGYFNTAYLVTLSQGVKTILKVSPPKDVQVMSYEKNIMDTEVYVLNKLSSHGTLPIPKVLHYDKSCNLIENEFFFMEFIQGITLNKIKAELTKEQSSNIYSELGAILKEINSVSNSYFGYISQENKRFTNWTDAFLSMIKELLEDAIAAKTILPYDTNEIYNLIYKNSKVLNTVKTPSLVHKDIWSGNIFIDPTTAKITGIIDCERALYGDALLDPVCGFLTGNEDFMKSYAGSSILDEEEELRVLLYQIYLYLIMVIECSYRKYPGDDFFNKSSTKLKDAILKLQNLS